MQLAIDSTILTSLCKQEDIAYLGLFGSQSRNEATSSSDVDILVDFNNTKSFFELARVKEKLEKTFGKPVDLVLKSTIKEQLKPYIMKDLVTIYGKD